MTDAKRLSDADIDVLSRRAEDRLLNFAKTVKVNADDIKALLGEVVEHRAPPSQGKVKRAREKIAAAILNDADDLPLDDIFGVNLLREGIGKSHSGDCTKEGHSCLVCGRERALRTADQWIAFLLPITQSLTESSGRGTDGAEAMREAAAKVCDTEADGYGVHGSVRKCGAQIRALPLPVSADGRDAVIEECAAMAANYDRHVSPDWDRIATIAKKDIAHRIRALKSKQPSDTGTGK